MIGKFKGKYRIQTNRLQGYDYGSNGMYFVTICTDKRIHYFGEITVPQITDSIPTHNNAGKTIDNRGNGAYLQATATGKIAEEYWLSIPLHYPFVILDEFIIMPNHLHGIICINKEHNDEWTPNAFGKQSGNLGAIIRGFKSSVKRYTNEHHTDFHWQSRFHDHIIRDERSLLAIKNYIINNPNNWHRDKLTGKG